MKLIIGLGNPGKEYENTRHNTGHVVAGALKNIKNAKVLKTNVFMNESGSCIDELIHRYKVGLSDLYIVHDDLDIKLGEYKIQFGRGPKDHNGIRDIEDKLSTKDFWRIRVGVDNRPLDNKPMGEEYVLQNFSDEERKVLDNVIREICKKLESL